MVSTFAPLKTRLAIPVVFALVLLALASSCYALDSSRDGKSKSSADLALGESYKVQNERRDSFTTLQSSPVTIVPLNDSDPLAQNPGCTCSCCFGADCDPVYAGQTQVACSVCIPQNCYRYFPSQCPDIRNQAGKAATSCVGSPNAAAGLSSNLLLVASAAFITLLSVTLL